MDAGSIPAASTNPLYWACVTLNNNYYEWRVVNIDVSPGDTPTFTIRKHAGVDNMWSCAIDGVAANDSTGDNDADNCIGNTFNRYDVGLESNCTSGELGSSSNEINITLMKKTSNGGDSWSFGTAYTYFREDPSDYSHGDWTTAGQSCWNWRNH